jgi:hypothetical protein
MKRSSARRARRWILQALTRFLEQGSGRAPEEEQSMSDKPEASRA